MLYHKPVRDLLVEAIDRMPPLFRVVEVVRWFGRHFPLVADGTVRAHVTAATVNHASRRHYPGARQDLLYRNPDGLLERYDPRRHGLWTEAGHPAEGEMLPKGQVPPIRKPTARPRSQRADRVMARANELIRSFGRGLSEVESRRPFSGPSVYFHHKTIALLRDHDGPGKAVHDELFIDYLYATLASWGMHRMGPIGAKLAERDVFASAVRRQHQVVDNFAGTKLWDIESKDLDGVSEELWASIQAMDVGTTATKLVVGSKTLAHLLPDLMPPIDRQYTLQYFYGSSGKTLHMGGRVAFKELFPALHHIALGARPSIEEAATSPHGYLTTSVGKVIDNAVVGAVLLESNAVERAADSQRPGKEESTSAV